MSAVEKTVIDERKDEGKYVALDRQLLIVITNGKNRHKAICDDPLIQRIAAPFIRGNTTLSRVVEGRMKRLRIRGHIKYDSKTGWKVMNV